MKQNIKIRAQFQKQKKQYVLERYYLALDQSAQKTSTFYTTKYKQNYQKSKTLIQKIKEAQIFILLLTYRDFC